MNLTIADLRHLAYELRGMADALDRVADAAASTRLDKPLGYPSQSNTAIIARTLGIGSE